FGSRSSYLSGVAAVSANDIWAVGGSLIEHWDGSNWSVVPSPSPSAGYSNLYGVAAVSANDVWAVGSSGYDPFQTLTEHWNGRSWSVVPSPNPGIYSQLNGVAAV